MSILALMGGNKSVMIPEPHFVWPQLGEAEEHAVLTLMRAGQISMHRNGGVVQEFEDTFAELHTSTWAMSTCSGSAALHAAYFSLDLLPGDEVIAPAYTHLSTVMPMLQVGLIPVLCDVEPQHGNINPDDIAHRITDRTRAIVITHQYGHMCDMHAILKIAKRFNLKVLEDCSHAHGASCDGRMAGTFGDVACFSLQAHKAVVAGEGGLLLTGDSRIYERACLLGHFRQPTAATSEKYAPFVETGYGLKNRLHPLAAAIALEQLKKLNAIIESRRACHAFFAEQLMDVPGLTPLPTEPGVNRGGFFRFLFHYDARSFEGLSMENFVRALHAEGAVEAIPGSLARPLHLTSFFQTLDDGMYRNGWPRRGTGNRPAQTWGPGDFPNAEKFSATTVQFPAFMAPDGQNIIAAYGEAIRKIQRNAATLRRVLEKGMGIR